MTMIRILVRGAVVSTLLFGSSACSDDPPTGPDDSAVTVSLSTPNADDGALLVVVSGGALTDVQPASAAYQLFWRAVSDTETRVIVVGDIQAGPLFTVDATVEPAALAVGATEIASRTDVLRPTTAGYSFTVSR